MTRPSPELTTTYLGSKVEQYGVSPSYNSHEVWPFFREWTGSLSPGYPGVLRINPHYVHIQWRRQDDGCVFYNKVSNTNWYRYTGPAQGYGIGNPANYSLAHEDNASEVRTTSRSRLISKVSRQKVNIAQNIGEYRQVHGMFHANTRRLVGAIRAVKRGDVTQLIRELRPSGDIHSRLKKLNGKSLARNPSSWWLEIQYGWLPLVGDVYDGVTNFYKRVEEGYPIKDTATATRKWDVVTSNVNGVGFVRYDRITRRRASCKTSVTYWVDNSRLANAQDWGIINPLLLAWELMPYSFVVDWFLPVGDWLSKIDYALGLTFKEGFQSYIVDAESWRFYKPVPFTAPTVRTVSGSDRFGEVVFRRTALSSFPHVPLPSFDQNGLRGKRIANALALLGVAFGR